MAIVLGCKFQVVGRSGIGRPERGSRESETLDFEIEIRNEETIESK
jgi:hypothetical protein